MYIHYAF